MPVTFTCPAPNTLVSQQFGATGTFVTGKSLDNGIIYVVCKAAYYLASGLVSRCVKCLTDGEIFACQFDLRPDMPLPSPAYPNDPPPVALSAQMYDSDNNPVELPGTVGLAFAPGQPNPCASAAPGTPVSCP